MEFILDTYDDEVNILNTILHVTEDLEAAGYVTHADMYYLACLLYANVGLRSNHHIYNTVVAEMQKYYLNKKTRGLTLQDIMFIIDEVMESKEYSAFQDYFYRAVYTVEDPTPRTMVEVNLRDHIVKVTVL